MTEENRKNMPPDVPYIVHESEMARMERENRRLWALCMALGFALSVLAVLWGGLA